MSTQAIFFDLDGTLLDTARDLGEALNSVLAQENLSPISYEEYRKQVSNGGHALVSLGFGTLPHEDRHQLLYQRLLQAYAQNIATHTCLFPGMEAVLRHCEKLQIPWGIVTNKPRQFTEALVALMRFTPACNVVVCPDDVKQRKPHPEALLLACGKLNCKPEHTLYVGDHRRDIECGRNAGAQTVAARYGYIDTKDDPSAWLADYYIDAPEELIALLDSNRD